MDVKSPKISSQNYTQISEHEIHERRPNSRNARFSAYFTFPVTQASKETTILNDKSKYGLRVLLHTSRPGMYSTRLNPQLAYERVI
eukprot:159379-Pleurochrysis_carterae.AAC.1